MHGFRKSLLARTRFAVQQDGQALVEHTQRLLGIGLHLRVQPGNDLQRIHCGRCLSLARSGLTRPGLVWRCSRWRGRPAARRAYQCKALRSRGQMAHGERISTLLRRIQHLLEPQVEHLLDAMAQGGQQRTLLAQRLADGHDAPGLVERDHAVGRDFEKIAPPREPEHMVVLELVQEISILGHARRGPHHLQHQMLAALVVGRLDGRGIEHGQHASVGPENRYGAAGQLLVRSAEMLLVMHGDGPLLQIGQRHRASALLLFGPATAQPQAGAAPVLIEQGIVDEVHRHAMGVGQQHHIAGLTDLAEQHLHAAARDAHEALHGLAMILESAGGQHARRLAAPGIEAIQLERALARALDHREIRPRACLCGHVRCHPLHCRLLSPHSFRCRAGRACHGMEAAASHRP